MPQFLCFTLEGPFASWGDIAPGEQRSTWARPSRSAALGLCAAALGIEREDETALAALNRALGFAVLAEQPGLPVTEFQTEQRPTTSGLDQFFDLHGRKPATRGEALETLARLKAATPAKRLSRFSKEKDIIATTTSRRSFHMGVRHRIALWVREGETFDLAALEEALKTPRFAPYLGRRAFPPSRPLAPSVMDADTLEDALTRYLQADAKALKPKPHPDDKTRKLPAPHSVRVREADRDRIELWSDTAPAPALAADRFIETNTRRDAFRSNAPRQYDDRLEGRLPFAMPGDSTDATSDGGAS